MGSFDPAANPQSKNLLGSFDPVGLLMDSLASGSLPEHLNLLEEEMSALGIGCTPPLGICLSKTLASQIGVEEEEVEAQK